MDLRMKSANPLSWSQVMHLHCLYHHLLKKDSLLEHVQKGYENVQSSEPDSLLLHVQNYYTRDTASLKGISRHGCTTGIPVRCLSESILTYKTGYVFLDLHNRKYP
jgi:hypothetical protein